MVYEPEMELFHLIFENIRNGAWPINLTDRQKKLGWDNKAQLFSYTDTIMIVNPETFELDRRVVKNEIYFESYTNLTIKQKLWYDNKKKQLNSELIKLNLSDQHIDALFKGDSILTIPKGLKKAPKYKSRKISQVFQLNIMVPIRDLDGEPNLFPNWIDKVFIQQKEAGLSFYKSIDENETMTAEEVNNIFHTIDSVIVVDPQPFELDTIIVKNETSIEDIKHVRLRQHWYYSEPEKAFYCKNVGMAILVPIYSEADDGRLIAEYPAVWIKFER